MSKKEDLIGYFNKQTGEELSKELVEKMEQEYNSVEIKKIFEKLNSDPNSLTLDELVILMKITKRNTKVKLDFSEDSYFTIRKNNKLLMELDANTVKVVAVLSQMISHDGRIKYDNNRVLSKFEDVRLLFNMTKHTWNGKVKPELDKHSILKKEIVNGKRCLLLNPLFSVKDRTVTETMFLAFYEELKEHLHPLDFLYLYKLHQIRPK